MGEVEPDLQDLGKKSGPTGDFPDRSSDSEQRIKCDDGVGNSDESKGVEVVPAGGIGAPRSRKHKDGSGQGEAQGGEPEDQDQNVKAAELLLRDGGVKMSLDSGPRRRRLNSAVSESVVRQRLGGPHDHIS